MSDTVFDRLFSRAIIQDNGCWEYSGPRNGSGYGTMKFAGQSFLCHRLAYDLVVGDISEGMFVLHRCDNRCCVNPEHLFLGTQQDNIDDMMAKGRYAWGSRKLSPTQADEIKRLLAEGKHSHSEIARRVGSTRRNVSNINCNVSWKE